MSSLIVDITSIFFEERRFFKSVVISDDKGGMAMDILFNPQVGATEQMAQNCRDISQLAGRYMSIISIVDKSPSLSIKFDTNQSTIIGCR